MNTVLKSIDEGCLTLDEFLDFQKAFDTINHNILFKKLASYGVRTHSLKWLESYDCEKPKNGIS